MLQKIRALFMDEAIGLHVEHFSFFPRERG
jgi:hypothetical protein